uniref:RNA-dependent RNA polymerase n=1 Tax=Botrytis cinerea mitovirus 6 TaxID=2699143 RepID=A0A857JRN1_9VIRU|nr:RNA-dependent RNA polymerase [Botrytis cinerea mitovirus 6]
MEKQSLSSNKQKWSSKELTKYNEFMFWKFFKVSVWLLGFNNSKLHPSFLKLATRIQNLKRDSGTTLAVQYLKECLRLCQKTLGGESTRSLSEPRVAIRRGLPLIIPGDLRLLMESKDARVIKLVLTGLSVFRVMPAAPKLKLGSITDPHSGLVKTFPEVPQVMLWVQNSFINNFETYFRPKKSLFTTGRSLLTLTTAGPNSKNQLVGYPIDALAFKENPTVLGHFKKLSLLTNCRDLWNKLDAEMQCTIKSAMPQWSKGPLKLGKLSLKHEPAGKVRVFAIVDAWTQSLLSPLHNALLDILKQIPQDGTFDQYKPVKRLIDKGCKDLFSFDLSAATDRLPIDIQVDVLSYLFDNRETAEAWRDLLIDRDYHLKDEKIRYSVGQPMGALSSWCMLALTHHIIVQIASLRVGNKTWFEDYGVLGDDIVIADKAVADAYLVLMNQLGVEINLHKSLISSTGSCEFAKKLFVSGVECSPLGPKSIFEFIRRPSGFKEVILHNNLCDLTDVTVLKAQLASLFDDARSHSSHKWVRELRTCYWDIVSCFGLNLLMDLSPRIKSSAIDSLIQQEQDQFTLSFKDIVDGLVNQGWFKAIEKDEAMYRRYRRFYSFNDISHFPSSQDLIGNFSQSLMMTASKIHFSSESEKLKYAFSTNTRLSWFLEDKPKISRKSHSLELSKKLLHELYLNHPDIAMKLNQASQADVKFDNLTEIIEI